MKNLPRDVKRKLKILAALEAGGVDNWEGYDFALEDLRAENEREEIAEHFLDVLCEVIVRNNMINQPAGTGCGYSIGDSDELLLEFVLNVVKEFK